MLDYKRYKQKRYLHFDNSLRFNKKVESYVSNPKKIIEHSFFPLIQFVKEIEIYDEEMKVKGKRPFRRKIREIMYASHLDNYIYKYFGENLNECYNSWVKSKGIDQCSIAYRYKKDEKGKSNIDYAAEVVNSIYDLNECFIMVGDFEKFFDKLDHSILKRRVAEVLGVGGLSEDWYRVIKSVTKFSFYKKVELNKQSGPDKELRRKKQFTYFKTHKDFREFRKSTKPCKNNKSYGIPQGTALSAILANVYATKFDVLMNRLIKDYQGIYRRYSDDFIIIVPKNNQIGLDEFRLIENQVHEYIDSCKLYIQADKTELFEFSKGQIVNINKNTHSQLDYLGFVFDGKNVSMRNKSPYKFYRNAYKLIEKAKKVQKKKRLNKIPYRRQLYRLYTDLGVERKPHGNFITYARNAQRTFDNVSPHTNNLMLQQIKNRKKKIESKLGVRLSINV